MGTPVQRSIRLSPLSTQFLNRSSGESGAVVYDQLNQTLRITNGRDAGGSILATRSWVTEQVESIPTPVSQVQADWNATSGLGQILNKPAIPSLTGYATENYVDTAVGNVSVDLTGYATENYVDTAIGDIPAVDLTGYATENYVDTAIGDIPAVPVATTSISGTVKVDGTSITITDGTISSVPTIPTGQIFNAIAGVLTAPAYLPCDGSTYLKTAYPTLSSLLGTPYDVFSPTAGIFGSAPTQDTFGFISGPSSFAANNGTVYCFIATGQVFNGGTPEEGGPGIWWSTDNANWTRVQLTMSSLYYEYAVGTPIFLKYLNGAFYACYTDAIDAIAITRLARSTNGTTWVDITETDPSSWGTSGNFQVTDITYGSGRLVLATQSSFLFSSTTGNIGSWTSESIDLSGNVKIAYGNNTWVLMAGYAGLYSTDNRVTWDSMMLTSNNSTNEIVFSNGVFVVGDTQSTYWNYPGGGSYRPIWTSTDGIVWTAATAIDWGDIPQFTDVGNNAVAISTDGSGLWVVLSKGTGLNSGSYLLYSTDNTATWTGLRLSGSFINSAGNYNYYGGVYDALPYVQTGTSSGAITFNGGFVIYQTFQDNSTGAQGVMPFRFIARTYDPVTEFITPTIAVTNQGQALGVGFLSYIKT